MAIRLTRFEDELTVSQAAHITGWSRGYLYQRIHAGKLRARKAFGRYWVVQLQHLGPQFEWPNYRTVLPKRGKPSPLREPPE